MRGALRRGGWRAGAQRPFGLDTGPPNPFGLDTGPPNPCGLPRTPNPKGTFAPRNAILTGCIFIYGLELARFARFCATKCYSYRKKCDSSSAYQCRHWRNSFCTVLRGLPMPAPAHLIGSPNPLVSRAPQTLTQKGDEQAPGIPTTPRNFSLDQAIPT